jgi:hypothetical protein
MDLNKLTGEVWLLNYLIKEPSDTFHNLIVLSSLPLANVSPFEEKATEFTCKYY